MYGSYKVRSLRTQSNTLSTQTGIAINFLETRKTVASDFDFVYSLYRQTLSVYSELKEESQRNEMQKDFDTLPFEIVCSQGEGIGAISVTEQEDALEIIFLAILPIHQRKGFGRQLLMQVLEKAAKRKIPVKLSVISTNPAKTFYEHLRFKMVGSKNENSFSMEL